jgi:hypothetical protein
MGERLGKDWLRHFPTRVQLTAGTNREGTHRTRSFLYAALGVYRGLGVRTDGVFLP